MFASQRRASHALLALALAAHISLPTTLLLPPVLLILLSDSHSHLASPKPFAGSLGKALPMLLEFLTYFGTLTVASSVVADGWGWTTSTWGAG